MSGCETCTEQDKIILANCPDEQVVEETCNCKFFDLLDVVPECSANIHGFIPYITPNCQIDFASPASLFEDKDRSVGVSPGDPNPGPLETKLFTCANNPLTLQWITTGSNRRGILCFDGSKFNQKIIDHSDWLETANGKYGCPGGVVTSNGTAGFYVTCPQKLYWGEIELANTYNTVQLPEDVNAYLTIPNTERTFVDNGSLRFSWAIVTPGGLGPYVAQTMGWKAEQDTYIEVNFGGNIKNGSGIRTTRSGVAILDSNNNKKRIIFSDRFESGAFDPDFTTSHEDFTNTAKYANLTRSLSGTGYGAGRIIPIEKDDIIVPIYKVSTFVNNTLEPNESVRQIRIEGAGDDFDGSFVQINERSEYTYHQN